MRSKLNKCLYHAYSIVFYRTSCKCDKPRWVFHCMNAIQMQAKGKREKKRNSALPKQPASIFGKQILPVYFNFHFTVSSSLLVVKFYMSLHICHSVQMLYLFMCIWLLIGNVVALHSIKNILRLQAEIFCVWQQILSAICIPLGNILKL